jgi:hypothetical protein
MPLRDHFRPPTFRYAAWEGFHAQWPAMLVQRMGTQLPDGYSAEPRARLGTYFEIDVGGFEGGSPPPRGEADDGNGVAPFPAPRPTLTVEADLSEYDEFEVLVYDQTRDRVLVAAVEFVSPANKDRPDSRRAFVAKCAALLRKDVCVSIVDVVTVRQFNLYADLLDLIGQTDPALGSNPPHLYAATLRGRKRPRKRPLLDTWFYPAAVGQPLPPLPIWLDVDLPIMLDLGGSYEDTCRVLRIP